MFQPMTNHTQNVSDATTKAAAVITAGTVQEWSCWQAAPRGHFRPPHTGLDDVAAEGEAVDDGHPPTQ
ncbi:hypothetical protein ABT124_51980 [Streptomyces sp. NPDC001982]|uniref:hypothetical protein n=1 Tax=Streptomyces sp. NPDC001982 TaxID=3154405 RepID=UPI003321E9C9